MITRLNNIGSTGGSSSRDYKKARTQNIHDGWMGFLSWLAVSQIFRVNGGGIGFCSFRYRGSYKRRYGFGFWAARGVMVSPGQLATVDHGLERIPFLGCASLVLSSSFSIIRTT